MTDCRFCRGERPAPDHKVANLGITVAYLHDDQFFPGWMVLVLERHATELFELTPDEHVRMMDDVTQVAAALHAIYKPRKINYEVLGNQTPHIHWHIIPRLTNDPAPREAVWTVRHEPKRLPANDLQARLARIRSHLKI